MDPNFIPYVDSPTPVQQQWMRDNFWKMIGYSPYFDSRLSWYPETWIYFDLYAIYVGSEQSRQHPDWILKDASGNNMYIPWDCGSGCGQYAADPSNFAWRRWWIDHAKSLMAIGYRGLWIDDVNLLFRVSDSAGVEKPPIDPNTGQTMTYDNWRRYMAEFVEQIRKEMPQVEIIHNPLWWTDSGGSPDQYVTRELAAANYINVERGVNDGGITGGTGMYSLYALFNYADRVHTLGAGLIIDDFSTDTVAREYSLAGYFMISNGKDALGNQPSTPDNFWQGYKVDPGAPLAARYTWNGMFRRDYQKGMVLMNEPGAPTRTVTLPGTYTRTDGSRVTSITLAAKQGAVLLADADTVAPVISGITSAPASTTSATVTWTTNEPADTGVEYGTASTYGSNTGASTLTTSHSVTLTGLTAGSTYNFRVRSRDAAGNLAMSSNQTLSMAVASAPQVISTQPAAGGSVALNASITAAFSSDMSASSITAQNFYVAKSGTSTPLSATVSYNASTRTASLSTTQLAAGSTYVATIRSGAAGPKSVNGAALSADKSWTFTVSATSSSVVYLSALKPVSVLNGWGPVENDRSNGESAAGDGKTLTINGVTYAKGLGVHARSEIKYSVPAGCSTFQASVGVDDETPTTGGSVSFEVWTDGAKVFDSGVMTGAAAAKAVSVSVAGKKELLLIAGDGGDGVGSDHGDWAEARLSCGGAQVTSFLSDMAWASATNAWGPVEKDRSNGELAAGDGRTLTLNGVTFAKGLGVHAKSDIRYSLGGSCSRLESSIGVDDETPSTGGSVTFEVWADGAKVYDSQRMTGASTTQNLSVDLTGKRDLALIVTDGGDGVGSDHADWANARITCSK